MNNQFENIEKSIDELKRNWKNVVIRYVDRSHYDKERLKFVNPKDVFDHFVHIHEDGIVDITLPNWNYDWACSVISLAFDKDACGLTKHLEIYNHNLNHPNKDIAWSVYCELKKLQKW
jgi:hypothetical protein